MRDLLAEAERNAEKHRGLPWMVVGGSRRERLAILRSDMTPPECAAAEYALFCEPEVDWVVTAGEAVLASGAGILRHLFVRRSFPGGTWEVHTRAFITHPQGVSWLTEWSRSDGEGPEGGRLAQLFVEPSTDSVRLVSDTPELQPEAIVQVPEGATPEDVARMAGHLMESWFVSKGRLPSAVLRYGRGTIEVRLMPDRAADSDATDLALQLAQDPETLAVGVFSRGQDPQVQPPADQLLLQLEFREGPALTWRRRYRVVAANRARWLLGGRRLPRREDVHGQRLAPRQEVQPGEAQCR